MTQQRGGGPKRTEAQKSWDYNYITPLFLKGVPLRKIAEMMSAERETPASLKLVFTDTKAIMKEWHTERIKYIDRRKTVLLARIELMWQTAWENYEASKKGKTKSITKQRDIVDKATGKANPNFRNIMQEKHTQESIGDHVWFARMEWCIEQECLILGISRNTPGEGNAPPPSAARDVIFETVPRKSRQEYQDAIVIPDSQPDTIQKLIPG